MLDSLAYIDQTIYGCTGLDSTVTWRNDEVMEVLSDVRALIVADIEPTLPGLVVVPVKDSE